MTKLFHVALMGCVMLAIAGCGASKAKTPQAAAEKLQEAVTSGDRAEFVACFAGTDGQKELLGSVFDMSQASDGFNTKVVEVFGEEGLAEFNDGMQMGAGRQDGFASIKDADLSTLEFTESEDGTTAVGTGSDGETFDLVKTDEGWQIPAPEMGGGGPMGAQMMEGMTELFQEMTAEVGKEGMTVATLKETFMTRAMEMMMKRMEESGMGGPGGMGGGYMP